MHVQISKKDFFLKKIFSRLDFGNITRFYSNLLRNEKLFSCSVKVLGKNQEHFVLQKKNQTCCFGEILENL